MKTLLLLLLVSLTNLAFAQDEYINYAQGNESYHQFKVGAASYLLADNVNVREKPSSKGAVVTNLPIGTAIEIVEIADKKLRLNGFETNWYKISFDSKDAVKTGYVWGGLIAEGAIKSADSKVLFLYGVASLKKEGKEEYAADRGTIQVRACKDNQELSKIELESAADYLNIYHWLGNYGNRGLTGIKDVLEFGESAQSCGGINAYNIIFWDGKKLLPVTTLFPGGDAPYYSSDDLIFPSDEGGEKGKIIKDEKQGWYNDETETDVIERHKRAEYVWTGTALKQTKVLINKEYDVKD